MFKIVAILATLALAQADPLGVQGYNPYGAYAHLPVIHHHHHEKQPFLSCYAANTAGHIAVNIKPRTYGYGLAGYGAGQAGLEATINVRNGGNSPQDVVISFTEQSDALQADSCTGAAYGSIIGTPSYELDDSHDDDSTMLLPTTITAMDSAMALAATKPLHHRLHTPRSLIV